MRIPRTSMSIMRMRWGLLFLCFFFFNDNNNQQQQPHQPTSSPLRLSSSSPFVTAQPQTQQPPQLSSATVDSSGGNHDAVITGSGGNTLQHNVNKFIARQQVLKQQPLHNNKHHHNANNHKPTTTGTGTATETTTPSILVYVLYHDDKSQAIATNFTSQHSTWTKPIFIRSTKFFEAIVYRDHFPFTYHEWKQYDYVGMISYKVATTVFKGLKYNPTEVLEVIQMASSHKNHYDVIPILRSSQQKLLQSSMQYHGKHFKIAWDALLSSMGLDIHMIRKADDTPIFYRSAFVCKPAYMKEISKLMSIAIETTLFNDHVAQYFELDAKYSGVVPEIAEKIFHKPYYEYHPFIYERLPVFFFHLLQANVCIGETSPCWNNFV